VQALRYAGRGAEASGPRWSRSSAAGRRPLAGGGALPEGAQRARRGRGRREAGRGGGFRARGGPRLTVLLSLAVDRVDRGETAPDLPELLARVEANVDRVAATTLSAAGRMRMRRGESEAALRLLARAAAAAEREHDNLRVAGIRTNLAGVLVGLGRADEPLHLRGRAPGGPDRRPSIPSSSASTTRSATSICAPAASRRRTAT